jgi:large subunit ribosomal protein L10
VKQASDLRARLIAIDANLRVVKNTLTERAADQVGADVLKQYLQGPTAFTFVSGDPVLAAKAIAAFRRETQLPEFKGGWMDGKELSVADIESLSRLPSLEVMHGQLVGMIASPLTGLARSLNAILSGIAIALGQIAEQGLLVGNAPAADAAPAEAASDEAAAAPANDGDEEAAAPADAAPADAAPADAPAAEADEPSVAEAVGAEDTPSAPAGAPDPDAAEEIPNQPMPAPAPAEDAGDDNETSNEEGDK